MASMEPIDDLRLLSPEEKDREILRLRATLERLQAHDLLTGLPSRNSFLHTLESEIKRANRYGLAINLLLIEVGGLRNINETLGHQAGDSVLVRVTQLLGRVIRDTDILGRYTGNRFALLLPHTDSPGAARVAEKLLQSIRSDPFAGNPGAGRITASIGIAELFPGNSGANDLLQRAGQALRFARRQGGDTYFTWNQAQDHIQAESAARAVESSSLEELERGISQIDHQMRDALVQSVFALMNALGSRDPYTQEHCTMVMNLSVELARQMGIGEPGIEQLRYAAMLHDLGKIAIPESILLKPGKLTDEEFDLMKQHPTIAAHIIRPISMLRELIPIIQSHQEWYDGRGYPQGLAGNHIPLGARIISVVDAYHAMTSRRPYRDAMPPQSALSIIEEQAGSQFDPLVVEKFLELAPRLIAEESAKQAIPPRERNDADESSD